MQAAFSLVNEVNECDKCSKFRICKKHCKKVMEFYHWHYKINVKFVGLRLKEKRHFLDMKFDIG